MAWKKLTVSLIVAALCVPSLAFARDVDREARQAFERGRAAFSDARYEEALTELRRAYALSKRGELLYNIGLAADRLRRDDEALAAFERYLIEVEKPTREAEVRERVRAIRASIQQRQAAIETLHGQNSAGSDSDTKTATSSRKRAIIGPAILGAVGLTGISLLTVGLVKNGRCVDFNPAGNCRERNQLNKTSAALFGAGGGAALLGAGLWFGLSGRKPRTSVTVGFGTVEVRGRF